MNYGVLLPGLFFCLMLHAGGAPLSAGAPITLENTTGKFDFIRMDSVRHRLLLAHTGNKTLDVIDLDSAKLLKSVPTGAAQDAAPDVRRHRYYVSVSAPPRMAIVDADKLEVIGEVPLPAAADLMAFNSANGLAYVCNDTAPELWVIDPESRKIITTLTFPGKGMEDLTFDPVGKLLFQVVKDGNGLFVVNLEANKIVSSWTTSPATGPHGVALVSEAGALSLLAAGANGKLVLISCSSGKVLSSADIASRVDEMAYDPELHLAYCASSLGEISVVRCQDERLTTVGNVSSAPGAKSIVFDPKTHIVWVAYSKGTQSFAQPFTPSK